MANLLGRAMKMGVNMSPMQVANNAKEASSSPPSVISHSFETNPCSDYPPKISMRSHRLTAGHS